MRFPHVLQVIEGRVSEEFFSAHISIGSHIEYWLCWILSGLWLVAHDAEA
jgi:hypothetical protein